MLWLKEHLKFIYKFINKAVGFSKCFLQSDERYMTGVEGNDGNVGSCHGMLLMLLMLETVYGGHSRSS